MCPGGSDAPTPHEGQETARAGEVTNCKQKTDVAVGTEFFQLFDEADSAGMRPPHLVEVQPQQLRMVRAASPRTTGPSLGLAVLSGGGEGVDSSALVFLVSRAVADRRKEDEKVNKEARMERIEDMILEGAPVSDADAAAWRRWAAPYSKKH